MRRMVLTSFKLLATCIFGLMLFSLANAKPLGPDVSTVIARDPGSTLPADWQRGPFMEIYVRGYQDSDGDGVGDLKGLTQRLDYLKDLGISGIWLMPIFPSQDRDHGYAVTDYRNVEQDYGSLADFDVFLQEAHKRGIGVIIDYVMNHSAQDHPLFEISSESKSNLYRDWYVWSDTKPNGWQIYGKTPWYEDQYGFYFAGFDSQMPEFNFRNPNVLQFHLNNLRFWLNRGVDGFRFDAVGNLVENNAMAWESQDESHVLMAEVRKVVQGYENRYMVCEAPGDSLAFSAINSCASSFAFGHQHRVISSSLGNPSGIEQVAKYFHDAASQLATFASNHDAFAGQRLWNRTSGDIASYKLAAATYLLQPGVPFIYYGEEIGMSGGKNLSGDHKLRTPMSWTNDLTNGGFTTTAPFRNLSVNVSTNNVEAQEKNPDSLLSFYRRLIALRQSSEALRKGTYEAISTTGWVMSFQRAHGNERVLVVYNYGNKSVSQVIESVPIGYELSPRWEVGTLSTNKSLQADAKGRVTIKIPAKSFQVFEFKKSVKN